MIRKVSKYILLLLVVFLIPVTTINAKEKTIGQLKSELNAKQKELDSNKAKKNQTQSEIDATNKKINETYSKIEKITKTIDEKTKQSEQLEKDIKKKNTETKDLMRYYQVSSSGSAMLEYIMGAESITDLIYRVSITEQITSYNKKVVQEMNDMIKENDRLKKELDAEKEEQKNLQASLNSQIASLNQTKSNLDDEGHSLEESISEMKKTINDWTSKGCQDSETPTKCMNRLYPPKKTSSGGSSSGYLPSGSTFYRPTSSGRISSEYGWRTLYGKPNLHGAIDISTPIGTTVYSVAPGRVAKIIHSNSGGGNQIIIHHQINGKYYTSYYCHLSVIGVSVGDVVTKDSIIGKSGNTGNSTGPHLHLGLATGRWYLDYYSYYDSGFIGHSFNPRNVIVFPPKGSSYSNR